MAKLLFGIGVADARNKLGGHVFSKNRNGAYVRQKVSPTQPRSTKQLAVRSTFGAISKAWATVLTDLQRSGWISLASSNPSPDQFGNPQILTGLQFYQKVNRNLSTIGVTRLDDAPPDQTVEGLTSLNVTATFTGSILTVGFGPSPLDAEMHLVITATPPVSPGKSFLTAFLKLVFADLNDMSTAPINIYTEWNAMFGALQPGQKIGVSAYVISDTTGAASTPASASTITGA